MSNPYLQESLLDYERKLEDALQLYKRRLDRLVWENLPKSEQDKYRFVIIPNILLVELVQCKNLQSI